jgi:hypothetical protein
MATSSKSSDTFPAFPKGTPSHSQFENWLFKVKSFMTAKKLLNYVEKPLRDMPQLQGVDFESDDDVDYIDPDANAVSMTKHIDNCAVAYNYIVQSLNDGQLDHVRTVHIGNAYMLMKRLKDAYGTQVSAATKSSILIQLQNIRRILSPLEAVPDCFARIDRLINDYNAQSPSHHLDPDLQKHYYVQAFSDDPKWQHLSITITQIDQKGEWTVEHLKNFLIDQENIMSLSRSSSSSSSHTNHSKRAPVGEVDVNVQVDTKALSSQTNRGFFRGRGRGFRRGRGGFRGRGNQNHHQHNNSDRHWQSHDVQQLSTTSHSNRGRGRGFRGRGSNNDRLYENRTCNYCNERGHTATHCPSNPHRDAQCHTCGNYGHISASCWKGKRSHDSGNHHQHHASSSIKTDPPHSKRSKQEHTVYVVITDQTHKAFTSYNTSSSDHIALILDSGATDHYVSDISKLTDVYRLKKPRTIVTANGQSMCTQAGSLTIEMNDHHIITLTNVLYVPDFHVNLISVYQIVSRGTQVVYDKEVAQVTRNGRVEWSFPRRDGIYVITPLVVPRTSSSSSSVSSASYAAYSSTHTSTSSSSSPSSESIPPLIYQPSVAVQHLAQQLQQLHLKHGHVNFQRIIKMKKKNSVNDGTNIRIQSENKVLKLLKQHPCRGCLQGKMKRKAMTGTIEHAVTGPMQKWSVDTMIFKVPTIGGHYNVTLYIDVHTNEYIVGFHTSKDLIPDHVIDTIKEWQTQLNLVLKELHSDNGTEFVNEKLNSFLRSQGTIHTTTTVNTPQHNAIVERGNQTIITMSSSVMHHAQAYIGLYGEAICCSAYIINRTINARNNDKTPIEMKTGKTPSTAHFHVWGCDVYYYIDKHKRDTKLAARSKAGIFVGYDRHNEAYFRVFDVDTESIIRTRDVVFHDNDFTEMKRLCINKQHSPYEDLTDVWDRRADDYLPDSVFDDEDTVVQYFNERSNIENAERNAQPSAERHAQQSVERNARVERNSIDIAERQHAQQASNNAVEDNADMPVETNVERNVPLFDRGDSTSNKQPSLYDEDTMKVDTTLTVNADTNGRRTVTTAEKRSSRARKPANPFAIDGISYSLLATLDTLTVEEDQYFAVTATLDEPATYKQAIESNDRDAWLHAINDELTSHQKNNTWTIVERNNDMNVIGSKWVFKIKRDVNGKPVRHKARLVAKGYNQQHGVDYDETFSPVIKAQTLRILIALSLHTDNIIEQLDVKTAFLNAYVNERIYVEPPDGMNINNKLYVLMLIRALYGIKQAPRQWHEEIDRFLKSIGYTACRKDTCLYFKLTSSGTMIIIGLFVDDIIVSCPRSDYNEWLNDKRELMRKYEMSDLGEIHHILGMKVQRTGDSIKITQDVYVDDKLKEYGFENTRAVSTPEEVQTNHPHKASTDDASNMLSAQDVHTYRSMVGSLMYASCSTRPDITHATNMVARGMSNPSYTDMIRARKVFKYLSSSRHYGLLYRPPHPYQGGVVVLHGYCDADYGGDLIDRKSTTGYCTYLNDNLITWASKKQQTVALSSCESEYMAITEVAKEIMWMRHLLHELDIQVETPTTIYVDNQSAIRISENDSAHSRTKHIDIKHHYINDLINQGEVKLEWISTDNQLADIFTKTLQPSTFISLRDRLIHSSRSHIDEL